MSSPQFFDVAYAINPHMLDKDGKLNKIDKPKAQQQWQQLKEKFIQLGFDVAVLQARPELYDFVFCANTFFAWEHSGKKSALLSNMRSHHRQPEVAIAKQWLEQQGFEIHHIPANFLFEAMGDCIWNLADATLYIGHGFRTSSETIDILKTIVPFAVTPLQLIDERFYHLDTCFFTINKECAAYVPEAFAPASLNLIKSKFAHAIAIDVDEAIDHFAGNAFCPDQKNIILHPGANKLTAKLKKMGLKIHEIDTSEYMKSGGSVFCLKNFIVV